MVREIEALHEPHKVNADTQAYLITETAESPIYQEQKQTLSLQYSIISQMVSASYLVAVLLHRISFIAEGAEHFLTRIETHSEYDLSSLLSVLPLKLFSVYLWNDLFHHEFTKPYP